MKLPGVLFSTLLLFGCGLESAGTAATAAKLQADQATAAKEKMEQFKGQLDATLKAADENARRADDAAK